MIEGRSLTLQCCDSAIGKRGHALLTEHFSFVYSALLTVCMFFPVLPRSLPFLLSPYPAPHSLAQNQGIWLLYCSL